MSLFSKMKSSLAKTRDAFSEKLPEYLKNGVTFAKARQLAAESCGARKGILEGANNNLGIEYITAAQSINPALGFKTVKRLGASHDSPRREGDFISASAIRDMIREVGVLSCESHLPREAFAVFSKSDFSDIKLLEPAIMAVLRAKPKEDFENLPDISEGVQNKLYSAIKTAANLESLYASIKVKRYTLARVRRLVLSAFLGIDNRLFMKKPPYIRVLGFSMAGEKHLRASKILSPTPVILRAKEIEALGEDAQYMFQIENRATDLYALSFEHPLPCGLEYTAGLIKR